MSANVWLALTAVGLILTAAGWAFYGAAMAQGRARPDGEPGTAWERAASVLGNAKLVWAWVLLLALAANYLALTSGSGISTVAAVGGAVAYAFLWAAVAALLTTRRRSRHPETGGSGGSVTWPSTIAAIGGLGGGLAVGVLLLAAWMRLGGF